MAELSQVINVLDSSQKIVVFSGIKTFFKGKAKDIQYSDDLYKDEKITWMQSDSDELCIEIERSEDEENS